MTRDPLVLTFVVAFPIVTMLIIGGSFGTKPDRGFDWVNPAHWYVASYLTVVIAATGLVMLPVHLASYRERGVLRRFTAAGFPRWSFAIAQLIVGLVTTALACLLLVVVATPVYGVPAVHDGWRVAAALALGAVAFVSLGVLLGSLLPSARAAQAVGLLLFFPSFLLGAGGPPPAVMGSALRQIAGPPAADPADQRRAPAVAGPGLGHRVARRRRRPGRALHRPGGQANGPVTSWGPSRSIRRVILRHGADEAAPAEPLPPRIRWVPPALFLVFVAIAVAGTPASLPFAVGATLVAAVAGALLLWSPRAPLGYAALATSGIAVLGTGRSNAVGWFAVCVLTGWCVVIGGRLPGLVYGVGALALFGGEWLWAENDPGWAAWMAGTTFTALGGLVVRHEIDLVGRLRAAQAGLAERARAEERNRVAREVHDVIAHTLTVSLLHVTSARLAVEHDPADAARALAEAERLGRESLDEVRAAVGLLRQDAPDGGGPLAPLPGLAALPALVERLRSAGADVTLTVQGDTGRLPAAAQLAAYRILQEALTNAIKHAPGASTVASLSVGAGALELTVDSAGKPGHGTGLGLIGMSERAQSVGGRCHAGPGGQGWLVQGTLPLATAGRQETTT